MEHVLRAIADESGVLLRREALLAGVDDMALHRFVRSGHLERIRQGAYALSSRWREADRRERHLMLCAAVTRQYGEEVALSHASAALVLGGPGWGLDLSEVHLLHLRGGGRRAARVAHHHGGVRVNDLTRADGRWITSPTRTILDVAATQGPEAGLVQANHFLHLGATTKEALAQAASAQTWWPGTLSHHSVLHLADARVESVGESRSMQLFWAHGLPLPQLQWPVFRPDGSLAGRCDFCWPELGVLGEFDGLMKYHRYRRPGETIEEMVMREKRREDELRELSGHRMMRWDWKDLESPGTTAARMRRVLRPAA
jgi:hypothetical protein